MIRHLEEELTKQTREFILLQARAFKNQPFIRFFARHMQDFPTLKTLDQAGLEAGTPKECFRNAYELLCRHPNDYIYVEGFASNIIPVYHAWLRPRRPRHRPHLERAGQSLLRRALLDHLCLESHQPLGHLRRGGRQRALTHRQGPQLEVVERED